MYDMKGKNVSFEKKCSCNNHINLSEDNDFDKPIKLKSLLPNIPDSYKSEVSIDIEKLYQLSKHSIEKGEKAPSFNLCKITITGTNIFCGANKDIPRIEMPQFKGFAKPGSEADKLPKDPKTGEVDTESLFLKMLKHHNIKISPPEKVPVDRLKATQNEIIGAKVAGMVKEMEKHPEKNFIKEPLIVSKDLGIVDGHHRFAALIGMEFEENKTILVDVIRVDMDIIPLIKLANRFSNKIGVRPQQYK